MDNLIKNYFEKKYEEENRGIHPATLGPLLTISREFGCPSRLITESLIRELNRRRVHPKAPDWKFINKEVVTDAGEKLNIDPSKVEMYFRSGHHDELEDILFSFSGDYKNSRRIHKTIRDVILSFAAKGHVIIVGRASVAITQGCPNALHIRLQAPMEWRLGEVMRHHEISHESARKMIAETDRKRTELIEHFLGTKYDLTLFDLVFNCKTLSREEIVRSILGLMEERKMIG
jgi:cytidylate kinase